MIAFENTGHIRLHFLKKIVEYALSTLNYIHLSFICIQRVRFSTNDLDIYLVRFVVDFSESNIGIYSQYVFKFSVLGFSILCVPKQRDNLEVIM